MQNIYVGCMLSYKGRVGHIRLYDDDLAVIKFKNGETLSLTPQVLEDARSNGELYLVRSPALNPLFLDLDKDQVAAIERFESYCNVLEKEPAPCAKGVREKVIERVSYLIDDLKPPSVSHLHKIYKRWISANKNMSEVLFGRKRKRTNSISSEIFELMDDYINSSYLKASRPTINSAYQKFENAYRLRGYINPCPSLSTFERRIRDLDRLDVIVKRFGKSAGRNESRSANSKMELDRILQRVELDTGHFNLGLKNQCNLFIGVPSIYFVVDGYSRVILGYSVHVGKPSETAACVIHTLRYAISQKADPLYPFFGIPETVVIDQGAAYISADTSNFLDNLKVEVINTATKMGWGKPMVERFIGTARTSFFQDFDGYLGKLDKKIYSDKTIKSAAKHTFDEFRKQFSSFIIKYHNEPHAGLNGRTPAEVWRESLKKHPPVLVDEIGHDQLLRGLREQRTLKHVSGITCDYQVFNSDELQSLYHRSQKNQKPGKKDDVKVIIYRDPLDANAITVVDTSTGQVFEVPNILGAKSSGFSFAELRLGRKALTTAEESPVWDQGIREGYSKSKKPRRKGPDVPLDSLVLPMDLDSILKSPGDTFTTNNNDSEDIQVDEDEDYAIRVE